MSHAYERVIRAPGIQSGRLILNVIFTDEAATRRALNAARELAHGLDADIRLIVPHVVPFPLPLERPASTIQFEGLEEDVKPVVYLCRDRMPAIRAALSAGSLVVLADRKHWWQRKSRLLAHELQSIGHKVILV